MRHREAGAAGIFAALMVILTSTSAAWAQLNCQSPAPADPCIIAASANIAAGIYDIRPRSLQVNQSRTLTITGAGTFTILANNIVLQGGGRIISNGTDGNITVNLEANGAIDMLQAGTAKSRVDVSGNFGGGTINLHAKGGNITMNGTLVANATNVLGFGGPINLKSDVGNINVGGDPSEGIKSFGNAQGGGGAITLDAPVGSIMVTSNLVPK